MQVCKYITNNKILVKHLKKREEVYSENVYDAAIDDIVKSLVEIHVDDEKTVQLSILKKPWKTE
jgi:hypothetical protein